MQIPYILDLQIQPHFKRNLSTVYLFAAVQLKCFLFHPKNRCSETKKSFNEWDHILST